MRVVLLGTGGYHPSDDRQTACLMLPELGVVLDAGTALYRAGRHLVTDELDIFLTHPHLDHIIGLTYLFDVFWQRPMRRVTAHGDEKTLAAIREHLLAPAVFPVQPPCEFRQLTAPVRLNEGGQLRYFPLQHPGGSLGFRLDWPDRSMAYVTDTTADDEADYVRHIRQVDLLIHECYFADDMPEQAELTGHSCISAVAQVASKANAKRLLLVHINPLDGAEAAFDIDGAKQIFPNLELGTDRMEVEF